jgi:predicted PurR-regulated permease PerM
MQFTPTQKAAAAWSLIAALVAFVVWLLAPVLTPFVVAAVLAYALTPAGQPAGPAGRGRMPRLLAVLLVELLLIIALLGVAC